MEIQGLVISESGNVPGTEYRVRQISHYQFRINGRIDIFPKSKKYHDIVTNHRGFYEDTDMAEKFPPNNYGSLLDLLQKRIGDPSNVHNDRACSECGLEESVAWRNVFKRKLCDECYARSVGVLQDKVS